VTLDATDRALVEATQAGLPLVPRPYLPIGAAIGVGEDEALARMQALAARGVVRRIAAAPNHYALGLVANGMTVWDVVDEAVSELGPQVGALHFVSHSYRRPRALPIWPYNLFAMVHGTTRDEVEEKRACIAGLLGPASRASDILYSTRILKKTGLRLRPKEG
jgi:DNA-binding Lrp family transcriptional regulator